MVKPNEIYEKGVILSKIVLQTFKGAKLQGGVQGTITDDQK